MTQSPPSWMAQRRNHSAPSLKVMRVMPMCGVQKPPEEILGMSGIRICQVCEQIYDHAILCVQKWRMVEALLMFDFSCF